MSGLVVTGWGAVTAAGTGETAPAPLTPVAVGDRFGELPSPAAPVLADFDIRAELGRKGTGSYDRVTGLAVTACGRALESGSVAVDDLTRERIGLVLGTTVGGFASTSDYSRDTYVQEKPYLVNPLLFPNTVMNCAAGQAAIKYGLKGVNSTVAGGPLAFHQALGYAATMLERGYADVMLVGCAEEFSAHRAWQSAALDRTGPAGEGAAIFVVERADAARRPDAPVLAEIPATASAFGGDDALTACADRVIGEAGLDPADIAGIIAAGAADHERLGLRAAPLHVAEWYGHCDAAAPALGLATVLGHPDAVATPALIVARTPDGGAGAAVLRSRR